MATTVEYNGVALVNCLTREFDQELMYDASGTDLMGVRYKLTFEGHVHAQKAATSGHGVQDLAGPLNTGATHLQFDLVSQRLSEPRQTFILKWENNLVLKAIAATAQAAVRGAIDPNTDVENGPRPRGLSVLHVTPAAIKVRFSIEIVLSGCPAGQSGSNQRKGPYRIINNRWSIHEALDENFFTTRRINGVIRFSEGLTPKHAYKAVVVPGLEKGFRRESIEYAASENGLEAQYSVVDRQVHYSAPWPATRMDVTHSYSTNDGLTWLDDCHVTLQGSPEADRQLLLARLVQIIDARCEGLRVASDDDKQYLLENVVLTEHFGEANTVSGQMTVRHMGEDTRALLGNILKNKLGKPLELPNRYDRTISRTPARHGYDPHGKERNPAFLFLLTCYHQDPCSNVKAIFGASQTAAPNEQGTDKQEPPYPVEVPADQLPSGNTSKYSQQHKRAMYTFARLHSVYDTHRLRVVLPLGKANSAKETAELTDLAPGVAKRWICYEADRVGEYPRIPSLADEYVDGSLKGYLLSHKLTLLAPRLSADGNKPIYSLRLVACFGLNKLPTAETSLSVGVLPFTSFKLADTKFPISQSQTTEIGP